MAVPKHRTSKQKKRSRRSHMALTPPELKTCSNCGQARLTHKVCKRCGFYKNQPILKLKTKKDTTDQKESK